MAQDEDFENFILMHAMGSNTAGNWAGDRRWAVIDTGDGPALDIFSLIYLQSSLLKSRLLCFKTKSDWNRIFIL
jgi:hypothetical protein